MFKDEKYEEWKVDFSVNEKGVQEFQKVQKIREVSINDLQADDMNNDSWCTKIRYYKVEAKKAEKQVTVKAEVKEAEEVSEKEKKTAMRETLRKAGVSVSNAATLEQLEAKLKEINK